MNLIFNNYNAQLYADLINDIRFRADVDESFKIVQQRYQVPNTYLSSTDVLKLMNDNVVVQNYSVWLEVLNADLVNNVTLGVSFATYFDDQEPPVEQQRTWNDLSVLSVGTNSKMIYWQGGTSEISHNDLSLLIEASDVIVHGIMEMQMRMSYEDYFVVSEEVPVYVPYSFVSYEQFDTDWKRYFKSWQDAQAYITGMWNALGGDRFYALKWRIVQPLDDIESAIAYADYPNFPVESVLI